MTAPCPECGTPRSGVQQRGPLRVQSDPPAVYWRGQLQRFTPRQVAMLGLLAQRGAVSFLGLHIVGLREDAGPDQLKVAISKLRRRLPPGVTIESVRGWGYELKVEKS